jgi:hypothetical protein
MGKTFTIKGGAVKSLDDFKKTSKGGGGGARFATRIPKEPDTITVRFLKDVTGWVWYDQVWDQGLKRYVVLTEENTEQYDALQPQRRYLAPAVDTKENRVIALELPKSLAKQVENIAARKKGSCTGGDIELWKTGSGTDTEYFSEWQGFETLDLDKYTVPDLWKIVEEMVEGTGAGEDDNGDSSIEDDTDDDDDDEEPVAKVKVTKPAIKRG